MDGHFYCCTCRDGTYATMSLQVHLEDPWTHYCDACGPAMASVIRDCYQKRDPEIRRLPPPPPKVVIHPVSKPPVPVKDPVSKPTTTETAPKQPTPQPVPSKPSQKTNVIKAMQEVEEYDLLTLLGWKK